VAEQVHYSDEKTVAQMFLGPIARGKDCVLRSVRHAFESVVISF